MSQFLVGLQTPTVGVHIAAYTGISYLEARRVLHGPKLLSAQRNPVYVR